MLTVDPCPLVRGCVVVIPPAHPQGHSSNQTTKGKGRRCEVVRRRREMAHHVDLCFALLSVPSDFVCCYQSLINKSKGGKIPGKPIKGPPTGTPAKKAPATGGKSTGGKRGGGKVSSSRRHSGSTYGSLPLHHHSLTHSLSVCLSVSQLSLFACRLAESNKL